MQGLNGAFYFVVDKIVELQGFFIDVSRSIAYVALIIAVCTAAFNHAINGTGLKESIVKTTKASLFYIIVMFAYPSIVSWITSFTFNLAHDSTYVSMQNYLQSTPDEMYGNALETKYENTTGTYGDLVLSERPNFFEGIINDRTFTTADGRSFSYSTVAPAAALSSMMLIAGECLNFSDRSSSGGIFNINIGNIIKGLLCAALVIAVGIFAVLEYLIAFIEFMFISSVGVILFPLSLWEGSKFMAEKFIGAIVGFFLKLLFCTICIFLMLYGFLALAKSFSTNAFTGAVDEIVFIAFTSLIFFFICKSAPALAQSLLTGTPSLTAAGAIGAVGSAVGGLAAAGTIAGGAAGIGARAAVSGAGTISRAGGAAMEAYHNSPGTPLSTPAGQKMLAGINAFTSSVTSDVKETTKNIPSDLTRSLVSNPGPGAQQFARNNPLMDGTGRSLTQYTNDQFNAGQIAHINKLDDIANKSNPRNTFRNTKQT